MLRTLLRSGALALLVAACAVTALPLLPSPSWWVRVWDFPRVQVVVALVASLALLALTWPGGGTRRALAVGAGLAALAAQLVAIWPYTPLHPVEARAFPAELCATERRLRLLTANVLMINRRSEAVLDLVRRTNPDVVLLVETDARWVDEMAPLRALYPHAISWPREDFYGFLLLSRFELVDPRKRVLIDDYVPSLRTGVRLPSGALVDLHGLHPRPPPHQDTARRDAELMLTALEARDTAAPPSVVIGDLNDVAWSRSTKLFQRVGRLYDPRIGRGPYPTFNARWPLLRWPLDHVFFEAPLRLLEFRVEGPVGSDHFPVSATLCHAEADEARPPPDASPADLERARALVERGRAAARAHEGP